MMGEIAHGDEYLDSQGYAGVSGLNPLNRGDPVRNKAQAPSADSNQEDINEKFNFLLETGFSEEEVSEMKTAAPKLNQSLLSFISIG
jgi:hypothetical protein